MNINQLVNELKEHDLITFHEIDSDIYLDLFTSESHSIYERYDYLWYEIDLEENTLMFGYGEMGRPHYPDEFSKEDLPKLIQTLEIIYKYL